MLDEFIVAHREELIVRTRERVATRGSPRSSKLELLQGIPAFIEQLREAIVLARSTSVPDHGDIDRSARQHGLELLRMGLTIGQVVHDYGEVCQTITEMAIEHKEAISTEEFRTLNLCLDDAIAGAVSEYSVYHQATVVTQGAERLGVLARQMRTLLDTAMLSFESIRTGRVAPGGSTSLVHGRALLGLRDLTDRSLTEVRLDSGARQLELISVAGLMAEIEIGVSLRAHAQNAHFSTELPDATVTIEGDREIVAAAISSLLQNAFKFSRKNARISLAVRTTSDRVFFDIEDECGGLTSTKLDELRQSFEQGRNVLGALGVGLTIAVRAARAISGILSVRDVPGRGCVFTLDLPRKPPPPLAVVRAPDRSDRPAGGTPGPGSITAPLRLASGTSSRATRRAFKN